MSYRYLWVKEASRRYRGKFTRISPKGPTQGNDGAFRSEADALSRSLLHDGTKDMSLQLNPIDEFYILLIVSSKIPARALPDKGGTGQFHAALYSKKKYIISTKVQYSKLHEWNMEN